MGAVVRERRWICGKTKALAERQDVEIYNYDPACAASREHDKKEKQHTPPAQANHNAKAARIWLMRLLDTNFGAKDTHTTLTYDDWALPSGEEQASRDIDNFLRHLRRKCKSAGLPNPEAIIITEHQDADQERQQKAVRYHHHVIMRCELSRDEIESCWHRKGVRIGNANADRLRKDKHSLAALAAYLTKYPKRKHRYKRTRGIKDPIMPPARDGKYSKRRVEQIALNPALLHSTELWARKYPGWVLSEAQAVYNDFLGWKISLKMHRERRRTNGN